jgi:hypothetical protein
MRGRGTVFYRAVDIYARATQDCTIMGRSPQAYNLCQRRVPANDKSSFFCYYRCAAVDRELPDKDYSNP